MKKSSDNKSAEELVSRIFMMGRLVRDEFHKTTRNMSCSFLHLQTLRYVQENDRPLMRDVAKYFLVSPPAATLLIDGLVNDGLLARIVDPKDRRTVRLRLTKKGNTLLTYGIRDATTRLIPLFSGLQPKEQQELTALLDKVVKKNN